MKTIEPVPTSVQHTPLKPEGWRRNRSTDRGTEEFRGGPVAADVQDENQQWLTELRGNGAEHHEALTDLWCQIRRATQAELHRRPNLRHQLGQARIAEIVASATDEATAVVLDHLDCFAGRSRFLTWACKFGVTLANAETRLALWQDRPHSCHDCFARVDCHVERVAAGIEPDDHAVQAHLAACPTCRDEADTLLALLTEPDPIAAETSVGSE